MDRKEEYGKREFLLTWVGAPKDPEKLHCVGAGYKLQSGS
jgi:hypothetical protein